MPTDCSATLPDFALVEGYVSAGATALSQPDGADTLINQTENSEPLSLIIVQSTAVVS